MSTVLANLLSSDHPLFTFNIEQLERAVGDESVASRLVADITEKAHGVMRSLSLDPADTSAEELYHALSGAVLNGRYDNYAHDTTYVLLSVQGQLVSFCMLDIAESAHHQLPFEMRKLDHAQRYLRAEIIKRYADHERTDREMVHKLAEQMGIKDPSDEHYGVADQLLATSSSEDNKPAVLMIGDIFTDAFIKLNEEYAVVEKDADGKEWLKLPFGQKPPYDHVDIVKSVGPSPNAAVSCARLGLDVSLMAWLGDDQAGKESLDHLKHENVNTSQMVTQKDSKSSYWYVLRHGTDRTMLVKSETYDYTWIQPEVDPEWIYLAYIGEDSWPLHDGLAAYLESHSSVKFVFQPATYHFEWGVEKLAKLYRAAYMVVMNREEAQQVTGMQHDDTKALAEGLHDLGPEIVVITDGAHGSFASHGGKLLTIPNYPDPAPPLDRTGAGDAFASTLTAALAMGKSLEEALTWAPINSASVVQQLGAQRGLLTMDQLKDWHAKAPDEYKVQEI